MRDRYFVFFTYDNNLPCSGDYLKITDENDLIVGKYSSRLTGKEVLVSGEYAVITFHSDDRHRYPGFIITFFAAQPSKCKGMRYLIHYYKSTH